MLFTILWYLLTRRENSSIYRLNICWDLSLVSKPSLLWEPIRNVLSSWKMGCTEWSSAWLTGCNIWKKLLIVSMMCCLQTRSLQIMVTNTVKATMGDYLLYNPKQRSLTFLDFQEMIWWSGSIMWTSFLSFKLLPNPKRFLWPPTI